MLGLFEITWYLKKLLKFKKKLSFLYLDESSNLGNFYYLKINEEKPNKHRCGDNNNDSNNNSPCKNLIVWLYVCACMLGKKDLSLDIPINKYF